MARALGSAAEVRFLQPASLETPLTLEHDGERARLREGEAVVAEGAVRSTELDLPALPTERDVQEASSRYPGLVHHFFPNCFCCGPARGPGDGLRVHPGRIPGRDLVAAYWQPDAAFADASGVLPIEIVWSALDCPAIWAIVLNTEEGSPVRVVSGTISVEQRAPVRAGEPQFVLSWPLGSSGKKYLAGVALVSRDGTLGAIGRQTCIAAGHGVPIDLAAWRERPRAS
jgi:hypothetical protein